MSRWKRLLHTTTHQAEQRIDALKARLSRRLQEDRDVQIVVYRGYGTPDRVRVQGRVLYHPGDLRATDDDSLWDNILNAYRRFESDELPDVPLRLRFCGTVVDTVSDEEGYFDVSLQPTHPPPSAQRWHQVDVGITEGPHAGTTNSGRVLIPPAKADFGIISDVDDTVLQTGATSLLTMARQTFAGNARTRLPFEGASVFYNALCNGPGGQSSNPLFFVSSSPWNLYDFLVDFLALQGFPDAPVLLRDLGVDAEKFIKAGHLSHKAEKIVRLLTTYPNLRFILIGDSGQHDPEIYRHVIDEHPGRIAAVYIRDVSLEAARGEAIDAISVEMEAAGVPFLRVADSYAAAEHAAGAGLMASDQLPAIKATIEQQRTTA